MARSITRDGDDILIRIPISDVHSLRVALAECPCRSPKSTATAEIRRQLDKGLAHATSKE